MIPCKNTVCAQEDTTVKETTHTSCTDKTHRNTHRISVYNNLESTPLCKKEDIALLKNMIKREKKLSFLLKLSYILTIIGAIVTFACIFIMPKDYQNLFLGLFLGDCLLFVTLVYILMAQLLFNHRKIANLYQDVFTLQEIISFETCATYFEEANFIVYKDENLIIANKILLQKKALLVRRDYLLQIVVTTKEINIGEYLEEHQKEMDAYLKHFHKELEKTSSKLIKVGCHIHFLKSDCTSQKSEANTCIENIFQEFHTQKRQRYLSKLDIIFQDNTLYYPSHIESYAYRRWSGQLLSEPYEEIAAFIHSHVNPPLLKQ